MQETQETWIPFLGWEDTLEKEMGPHSDILAWKTPWTKEPGELQSMGSQRVGHNWSTEHACNVIGLLWKVNEIIHVKTLTWLSS